MPRLVNSQTGVIVNVDEETAKNLGPEWSAKDKSAAASETTGDTPQTGQSSDKPAGNASLAEWQAYATGQGKTEEELKDLKREDIKALFESE